jgi:hypothetical protein
MPRFRFGQDDVLFEAQGNKVRFADNPPGTLRNAQTGEFAE